MRSTMAVSLVGLEGNWDDDDDEVLVRHFLNCLYNTNHSIADKSFIFCDAGTRDKPLQKGFAFLNL
jgi:hypothetical protein